MPHGRAKKRSSLFKSAKMLGAQARAKELAVLFQKQPKLKVPLLLFKVRPFVPRQAIEAACKGSLLILTSRGIIAGQKGGKNYALTNSGKILLERFTE